MFCDQRTDKWEILIDESEKWRKRKQRYEHLKEGSGSISKSGKDTQRISTDQRRRKAKGWKYGEDVGKKNVLCV